MGGLIGGSNISRIYAPNLGLETASRYRVPSTLKVITGERRTDIVAVFDLPLPATSMALFRGCMIPSLQQEEKIDVMVKVSTSAMSDEALLRETELLRKVADLPGFPRVLAEGVVRYERLRIEHSPYFVMPLIEGQDLSYHTLPDWSAAFPSREGISRLLVEFLSPLAERVASLHDSNIVHRDIKPNNVFCSTDDGVILLDFGRANYLTGAVPRIDHGTLGFFPPEMVDPAAINEDPRSDVYGFGATCFALLSGKRMILFSKMRDPSTMRGVDFMFVGRETVISEYLKGLSHFAGKPFKELLELLNLPAELKETELGRYMAKLFHPNREGRPDNMHRVAEEVRRLGGEFAALEIWAN